MSDHETEMIRAKEGGLGKGICVTPRRQPKEGELIKEKKLLKLKTN